MINDDEVLAIFKKYLHFNSQEDANEFHRVFFEWLNAFSGEMVNIGLKNGFSAGVEACANSLRKLDEENVGYNNLTEIADFFESNSKKDYK
jgi:hypothetical protein